MIDERVPDRAPSEGRGLAAQWVGLLLAPLTWAAKLQLAYALVPWTCTRHQEIWLHLLGVASVVIAAVGTAVAWRVWRGTGPEPMGEEYGPVPRARFLGVTGFGFSGFITTLLLAQWIVAFFISPCQ